MGNLNKLKAKVLDVCDDSYSLQDVATGMLFSVPFNVIHKIATFSSPLIDITGKLVVGSVIDMVEKKSNESSSFYPDLSSYKDKNQEKDVNVLAAYIRNFMDHQNEVEPEVAKRIVKALARHDDKQVIALISEHML